MQVNNRQRAVFWQNIGKIGSYKAKGSQKGHWGNDIGCNKNLAEKISMKCRTDGRNDLHKKGHKTNGSK